MDPPAVVTDYDPSWPTAFERIRSRVEPAVSDLHAHLEHVGSTAVPGLAAKPIIDVDVVVQDVTHVRLVIELLREIGYVHQGDLGVTGREAFHPPPQGPYHHLYVVVEGSPPYRDHVDLRDYLCRHPHEARRYSLRKREIAHLLAIDREAYVRGKSEIIEQMLARARRPP